MRGWLTGLTLALFAHPALAAPQDVPAPSGLEQLQAECRKVLCRQPRVVRLGLPNGKDFEGGPRYPVPIVTGGMVTILAGETIMVEGSLEDGMLTDLTAVPKVIHPERTLVFTLRQDPSVAGGFGMSLSVESPFPGVLRYRLGTMGPSDDRLRKTSVCPLRQGITSYEFWTDPLFQVAATDFRQVDPSSKEATTCE